MTDLSNYIGGTEANPQLSPMTPEQRSLVKQIGVPEGRRFVRPDSSPEATRNLPPDALSIDTKGRPQTGPFEDPTLEANYRKRLEDHDDAENDRLVKEVYDAADEEQAAETPEWRSLPERMTGMTGMGAVAADVGQGILETPRALAVGAYKAVNSVAELGKQLDDWARTTPLYAFQNMTDSLYKKAFADDSNSVWKDIAAWALKAPDPATGVVKDVTKSEASIKTGTGNLVKNVAQFMLGFAGVGKVTKPYKAAVGITEAAGPVAKAAVSAVEGSIAQFVAFDGQEKNLSNLIQSMPELQNPVTEFLAVDEDTPEIVGRLKSTLEGALTGVAADGVIMGLRSLKQARRLRAAESASARTTGTTDLTLPEADLAAQSAKIEADVEKLLKPKRAAVAAKKLDAGAQVIEGQSAKDIVAEIKDPAQPPNIFNLKLHTFETGEDIQTALLKQTEKNAKNIDEARRGVQTWAETGKNAKALDAAMLVVERARGQAFNAEESLAVRQMLIASEEKTMELAKLVDNEPNNVAAAIALRRSLATTHAILKEAMGARAEAGRALQAWRIPAGASKYAGLDLEAMLREAGGAEDARKLAKMLIDMKDKKGGTFAMASGWQHTGAALKMIYTNGLLSGPTSAVVNVMGNTIALIQDFTTRAAIQIEAGVTEHEAGEAAAILSGYMNALRDVFRLKPGETVKEITMNRAREMGPIRALAPGLDSAMVPGVARGTREEAGRQVFNPADPRMQRPLSAAAFNINEHSTLGRVADFAQMLFESPSNLNALGDDFFATVAARGELHAQAVRQATKDLRAQGIVPGAQGYDTILSKAVDDYIKEPTRGMLDAVEKQVKELTFSRSDGGAEQAIQKLRRVGDSMPGVPLGTMLLPFVRTPMNLMSYAIRHSPMAPLSMRWQNALAAGGAERELALTQAAIGTALWGAYMEAHANGDMTGGGPGNKAQRDAMTRSDVDGGTDFQPYSVKIDGRWYAYDRLDPVGQNMAIASDFMEMMANEDWDESTNAERGEQLSFMIMAMGNAMLNKATLKGTFDTVEALTGDSTTIAENELGKRLTSLIPFSAGIRAVRRATDPSVRDTSNIIEMFRNSVPGLSEGLPKSYDLWGNERTYQSGLGKVYDVMSPIKSRMAGGSATDLEILDNGVSVAMPSKTMRINGVNVSLKNDLDIYEDLVKSAGKPAFDHLESVINGEAGTESEYYYGLTTGPTGGRAEYIKKIVEDYRSSAREVVMEKYAARLNQLAAESLARINKRGEDTGAAQ